MAARPHLTPRLTPIPETSCGPGGQREPLYKPELRDNCLSDGSSGGYSGATTCSVEAGTDWLSWTEVCQGCGSSTGLVSLNATDAPIDELPKPTPTRIPSLDSRAGTKSLCRPLRDTPMNQLIVDPEGRFTVTSGEAALNPYAIAYGPLTRGTSSIYLDRCGSREHVRLSTLPMTGNNSELLFYPSFGRKVHGLFLRTRQHFSIELPLQLTETAEQSTDATGLVLTSSRLYVTAVDGSIWWSAFPRAPI